MYILHWDEGFVYILCTYIDRYANDIPKEVTK